MKMWKSFFVVLLVAFVAMPVGAVEGDEAGEHGKDEVSAGRRKGENGGGGGRSSKADKCYVGRPGGGALPPVAANTPAGTAGSSAGAAGGAPTGPLKGGVWAKCDGCHGDKDPITSVSAALDRINRPAGDPEKMPKGGSLDASEIEAIRKLQGG